MRRATGADHAWIAALAAEVYSDLGDYGSIIRSWLAHPGVTPYLERIRDRSGTEVPRGFILLGFYQPEGDPSGATVADLLAIAVDPAHQRKGVGRGMLAYAIELAGRARDGGVSEMRLTVAETNPVARGFFSAAGFQVLDEHHGRYDRGQRAIRMTRPIP
jgi:ribosomal protein S18 acetylase RimI-like enzyme